MIKKLLALIAIISTLSMVSTMVIQETNAAPKEQKTTAHYKNTCDLDTDYCSGQGVTNYNGPDRHQNCKYSFTSDSEEFEEKCRSN